jgi:NAD+ diphosphatase
LEQLKEYLGCSGFFFINNEILQSTINGNPLLPLDETQNTLSLKILSAHVDGSIIIINSTTDFSPQELSTKGYKTSPVKPFLAEVGVDIQSQLIRAYHWLNWHKQSTFCSQCATLLEYKINTPEKKCPTCNISVFPRFSPAVMVLIQKGDQLLLARSPHFKPDFYSAIAGFIDIGETAEQAAHREVKEELGLEITDLEYFATQTWPFPDSFMIAFKANYLRGEINMDANEIEDAQWFSAHDLPMLPLSASIARHLIDSALAAIRKKS